MGLLRINFRRGNSSSIMYITSYIVCYTALLLHNLVA